MSCLMAVGCCCVASDSRVVSQVLHRQGCNVCPGCLFYVLPVDIVANCRELPARMFHVSIFCGCPCSVVCCLASVVGCVCVFLSTVMRCLVV